MSQSPHIPVLLDEVIAGYPTEPDAWWMPARLGGSAPTLEKAAELEAAELEARRAKKQA